MSSPCPSDAELLRILHEAYEEAWESAHNQDGWKEEKKSDEGDIVYSKKNKKGKKMYKISVIIDAAPDKLIKAFENSKDITKWNTTLSKQEILKKFDKSNAKVTYQVTTEAGPGGVVSARDFIFIAKSEKRGNTWMEGGVSVEYPGPKTSKIVRAWNHPGGQLVRSISGSPNKCEFTWLMNCEFRGWIPGSILEIAMPQAQIQFVACVRELAKTLI